MSAPDIAQIARSLTKAQRDALLHIPGADRACLLRPGLGLWGRKFGYRFPTIKLSTTGHAVRDWLKENER